MFLFFEGGKRRRKTGRERTEDRKRRDKAARRERTKQKDPLIQITNNLFLRHYDKYNIYIL